MAKFFKYKSLADIRAENDRLGLRLEYDEDLSCLFEPVNVGLRTVGNRWCIHPMEGCDGELDGTPGELTFRRYRRFGAGGAKILWGEACAVNAEARANPRQITLNDHTYDAFARLVEATRQAHRDAGEDPATMLFGLQLTHSGRYSQRPVIVAHDPLLDRRTVVDRQTRAVITPDYPLATDEELQRLVDDYIRVAKLAALAGFDFVDVKQCHRYLLNELLGAKNRPGPYGGSFENRTRLAREIFQGIRAAAPSLLLTTRMNGYDAIPFHKGEGDLGQPDDWQTAGYQGWGLSETDPHTPDLEEPLRWVRQMHQELGVVLVNIALGNPYAQPHFGRPFEYPPPDGYESPEHPLIGVQRHFDIAGAIQQANPDLPVVGTGYSYLQEFMPNAGAANVRRGRITFVGVGRASLAQPDWVHQLAQHGQLDRKRICRTFSYCTAIMRAKDHPLGQYPTGCPPFDKEAYGDLWKEVQQLQVKKVAPAGS